MANVDYRIGPLVKLPFGDSWAWSAPTGSRLGFDSGSLPQCGSTEGDSRPKVLIVAPAGTSGLNDWDLLDSGDCREIITTQTHLDLLSAVFGVAFPSEWSGLTLAETFLQAVMVGDPTGDELWKPAVPNHQGFIDLHLPLHSLVVRQKFGEWNPSGNPWHNRVRQLIRHDLKRITKDLRDEEKRIRKIAKQAEGKDKERLEKHADKLKDDKQAKKILDAYMAKYKCDASEFSNELQPMAHETSLAESFDGSDDASISTDYTWTEYSASDWDRYSNAARRNSASTVSRLARCDSDLSSDDQTVDSYCSSFSSPMSKGTQVGGCTRFSSSAETCYVSLALLDSFATHKQNVFKIISGTLTKLGESGSHGAIAPATHWVGLESDGSVHTSRWDESDHGSGFTDSAITGNTRGGIYGIRTSTGSMSIGEWQAADLVASAVLSAVHHYKMAGGL